MTGVPYIDACMRELNATGWIPYHQRKTTACFLCHDLKVDWRFGGFHYEEVLLDYDVAMNYGNWTFCARVDKPYGNRYAAEGYQDPEHNCVQKSIKANMAKDPTGQYIRGWCPELKDVPDEYINCPWMMPAATSHQAGCIVGKDYPQPLVGLPEIEEQVKKQVIAKSSWARFWDSLESSPIYRSLDRIGRFPAVGGC